ncbi:hypothetical protein ABTQ08_20470, partial [Acinetobacter baumannii]
VPTAALLPIPFNFKGFRRTGARSMTAVQTRTPKNSAALLISAAARNRSGPAQVVAPPCSKGLSHRDLMGSASIEVDRQTYQSR